MDLFDHDYCAKEVEVHENIQLSDSSTGFELGSDKYPYNAQEVQVLESASSELGSDETSDDEADSVSFNSSVSDRGVDMDLNDAVVRALRRLHKNVQSHKKLPSGLSKKEHDDVIDFFCAEDSILSKNVKVSVDGIGELSFPIVKDAIRRLIDMSEKAKFGKGEKTILDVHVRDTQMIPASKLNVQIEEGSVDLLAAQIAKSLNINKNSTLVPHLHNMLIYAPGQFFAKHRDSEKVDNMVATMVILLPSAHTGGELIIEHQNKKHRFFGSQTPDITKCVAFYSDCYHEVKKVKSGYRVALTYNLQLKCEDIHANLPLDNTLKDKVNAYFEKKDKLMFYLNHSYSEHSLKWNMLKSVDWKIANALLAVAKNENYVAYLALAEYHETRVVGDYYGGEGDVLERETTLNFSVDVNNTPCKLEDSIYVCDDDICYTIKTKTLLEPYSSYEETGPTGNAANTGDYWYKRACVLLWPSNWLFPGGFNEELQKLHNLTTQEGMEEKLLQKINNASRFFFNTKFWDDQNREKFLEIAVYVSNLSVSANIFILLSPLYILNLENPLLTDCVKRFLHSESWPKLFSNWKKTRNQYDRSENKVLSSILQFILKNLTYEHALILLNEALSIFIALKTYRWPSLDENGDYITSLRQILQISESLNAENVERKIMEKLGSDLKEHNMISGISQVTILNNVLPPKHFLTIIDACLKTPDVANITRIFQFFLNKGNKFFAEKLVSAINDPKCYSPNFLCELFISFEKAVSWNQLAMHQKLLTSILLSVNSHLAKKPSKNDWSIPYALNCNCQHCQEVQQFLFSRSSMSTFIAGNQSNRSHVGSILSQKKLPLVTQTERFGNRYRLIIKKSPSFISDREKEFEKFEICKKRIIRMLEFQAKTSTDSPPSKIQKVA